VSLSLDHSRTPERVDTAAARCRRHNGEMSTALVVDRSLHLLDRLNDVYLLRNLVASEVGKELGPELAAVITYSEVARSASIEEATEPGFDYVYGSNLPHALLMARVASRTTGSSRIVLMTYSMPSAHHISGDVCFNYPPVPRSLEAARIEAGVCGSDGIRIDAVLVVRDSTSDDAAALEEYFRPIAEATGGEVLVLMPNDQVEASVDQLLSQ
jgi:uncharacterized protein with von Willebrand factor type A (vWA) domain